MADDQTPSNNATPAALDPLDPAPAVDKVSQAGDELQASVDKASSVIDQGIGQVEAKLDGFIQKQETVFGALDNFLKKF